MIELNVQQGTPEWHAARAKCFNASEAPAMMGESPYMTRSELLRQKATGLAADHDTATLMRFAAGHDAEAKARPIVERIIGEELYPVVATDDAGRLLASSDGATMLYDAGFEHKLWNETVAAQVRAGEVPDSHKWQLDHQCAVFGFERIIFVCSDGNEERFVWCEYRTTPERIARLMAGWEQFERDMAAYMPEAPTADSQVGRAPDALPALRIEVTGMVTASNLEAFKSHAMAVFAGIKTDLQTDADFADAEKTVKWAKEVEDKLDAAKSHALSQTASIDDLFRTIDAIKDEARAIRLKLDKLVKSEKDARRLQITTHAHQALISHIQQLNARISPASIPSTLYGPQMFGESIKGLKSLDSMRDKVSVVLANAKIEANAMADRIEANRKVMNELCDPALFPDFSAVCTKAPEDFAALVAMRVTQQKEADVSRLAAERERIRAEEQAKAQREAQESARREAEASAIAEREARAAIRLASSPADQTPAAPAPAPQQAATSEKPSDGKAVTLGQINARIAPIQISAAGLAELGIQSVGRDRSAVLYRESDIGCICAAMVRHLSAVSGQRSAA